MIHLDTNSRLAKWFVWSCDHLPLTVTREHGDGKPPEGVRRHGAYYLSRGTTLCHIFWAVLWVPLFATALVTVAVFLFVFMHVSAHDDFVRHNYELVYYHPTLDILLYFVPEAVAVAIAAIAGFFILALIAGSKVGFFALLWQYLKGIKQRICPLVHFDGARLEAAE
jgi:hypothetical protein